MLKGIRAVSFLVFLPFLFFAHEFNPAHLVVKEVATNTYETKWMYPVKNIGARGEVVFPNECLRENTKIEKNGRYLVESFSLTCAVSLKGETIKVKSLSVLTDALITVNHLDTSTFEGLINSKNPFIEIPSEEQIYPTGYFKLGIDHLLGGNDHIIFIFGLLFLVSNLMVAIKTITAFTVAHSITLGLSVFGLISLPQATVEAIIALTIIYLAYEISDKKIYSQTPWLIAFGFGLLHGLGFANVLSGIGIANEQMAMSLLFFNLGIEVGQLILIPIFALLLWMATILKFQKIFTVLSYIVIGSLGSYWFIDRVAGIIL
jgi:hypothetical protein